MLRKRKRNRLVDFDYSKSRYYFITFCTHQKQNWFGQITLGEMYANANGNIALQQWDQTMQLYNENIISHAVVLMPNHMHAILEIKPTDMSISLSDVIGYFKRTTSLLIHQNGIDNFKWQRSFHDHIIRDQKSFDALKKYIEYNPQKWQTDCFYKT